MLRVESGAFKKYKEEAKPLIMDLLREHHFLSQRSIQILLESRKLWHTVTWNAIRELKKEMKLRTAKYPPRGNFQFGFMNTIYVSMISRSKLMLNINLYITNL